MIRYLLFSLSCLLFFTLSGCMPDSMTKWEEEEMGAVIPAGTVVDTNSEQETYTTKCSNYLCVEVYTVWESYKDKVDFDDSKNVTPHLFGDDKDERCDTSTSPTTCHVKIPEAKLYYSSLYIKISTDENLSCDLVKFSPYYYQYSNSDAFVHDTYNPDEGADGLLDCSLAGVPAKCIGGAASSFVSNAGYTFPNVKSLYFVPAVTLNTMAYHADSANSSLKTFSFYGNRWIANYGVPGASITNAAGAPSTADYLLNGIENLEYKITCEDVWGELQASVSLTIEDENPAVNQYQSWEVPSVLFP